MGKSTPDGILVLLASGSLLLPHAIGLPRIEKISVTWYGSGICIRRVCGQRCLIRGLLTVAAFETILLFAGTVSAPGTSPAWLPVVQTGSVLAIVTDLIRFRLQMERRLRYNRPIRSGPHSAFHKLYGRFRQFVAVVERMLHGT